MPNSDLTVARAFLERRHRLAALAARSVPRAVREHTGPPKCGLRTAGQGTLRAAATSAAPAR
eukprot:15039381-Alexandrium_andersonii.AAC.1